MASEPPSGQRAGPPPRIPWAGLALTAGGLVAIGLALLLVDPLRGAVEDALAGDTDALREDLRSSPAGVAILYGLILIHTFVWYPAEIVDAAAGFVYDFPVAFTLVMSGWVVQGLIAYAIGRNAARPLLYRFIGERRFMGAERAIEHGGVTLLLAARLVPIVPFSLFSYVAGAARVPVGRFAWTTAVGYMPLTAIFIYYGSRLHAISLSDPVVWAGGLVLLALMLLVHRLRPLFHHDEHHPAERES